MLLRSRAPLAPSLVNMLALANQPGSRLPSSDERGTAEARQLLPVLTSGWADCRSHRRANCVAVVGRRAAVWKNSQSARSVTSFEARFYAQASWVKSAESTSVPDIGASHRRKV